MNDEKVMVFKGEKYKQAAAVKDARGNSLCTGCDLKLNDSCVGVNLHRLEVEVFGETCTQSKCIYVKAE